jgi:hypothetical protein
MVQKLNYNKIPIRRYDRYDHRNLYKDMTKIVEGKCKVFGRKYKGGII